MCKPSSELCVKNVHHQMVECLHIELCGNGNMLDPFFFNGNVNRQSYLNFLTDEVIQLITVLFQNKFCENWFQRLWWAHDGAPCHGLLTICARLNQLFGKIFLSLQSPWTDTFFWLPSGDKTIWIFSNLRESTF